MQKAQIIVWTLFKDGQGTIKGDNCVSHFTCKRLENEMIMIVSVRIGSKLFHKTHHVKLENQILDTTLTGVTMFTSVFSSNQSFRSDKIVEMENFRDMSLRVTCIKQICEEQQ